MLAPLIAPDALMERERQVAQRERILAKAEEFVRTCLAEQDTEHAQRMRKVDELLEMLAPEDREQARQKIARHLGRRR